jgi:tetratricopeptide (TPR) repeat protein
MKQTNMPPVLERLLADARAALVRGAHAQAARCCAEAEKLAPDNLDVLLLSSRIEVAAGDKNAASAALARLAQLAELQQDWATLRSAGLNWFALAPASADAARVLARAHWELGEFREAAAAYQAFLERAPPSSALLTSFARLCLYAHEYDRAQAALEEADRLDPANPDTLSAAASLAMIQGKLDAAQAYCRRALQRDPRQISALRVLTQISGGRLSQADFEALQSASERADLPFEDKVSVHFLLGDCLDARGAYDAAFCAYHRANELALSAAPRYDPAAQALRTWNVINAVRSSAPIPALDHVGGPTPIFVVGMPRSGTTLIESVLGAHPRVKAFGERDAMRRIAHEAEQRRKSGAAITADVLRRWRDAYLRQLPDVSSAEAIVDKNPWNFDSVWLIRKIFPNARIVHVRRDARETGLSIYRNHFPRFMTFTNRLEDIGHYYGEYARVMAAVAQTLKDEVLWIQYECFAASIDEAARGLVAWCGLAWDDACARFWTAQRPIATMSAVQARQPASAQTGRASHYAAYLSPLLSSLQAAGVDMETGALRPPGE